jgi:protocatechuate 3,4-dioxygenase beta subunit
MTTMIRGRLRTAIGVGAMFICLLPAVSRADLVRGTVTDELGNPVFNADFNVYDARTGNKLTPSDKSDATGKYRLIVEPGRYDLLCRPIINGPDAPAIKRGVLVSGTLDLDFVVPAAARVRGRVYDPISTNGIYPCDLDFDRTDDGTRQPALGDITSPFGTFQTFIGGSSYTVTANPDTTLGFAPTRIYNFIVPTPDPATDVLLLPVVRAVYLNGFIRDTNGAPVVGAQLKFDDGTGVRVPAFKHTSAADGSVRVGIAPGVYRVTVEPKVGTPYAAIRVPGVDMTLTSTHDFTVAVGAVVTGTVTDKLGRPVAAADWDAVLVGGATAVTPGDNTDFDGTYRFVVAPGLYRLRLLPPPSTGLDSVVFNNVDLSRDFTLDVDYAALSAGGGGASPVIRFKPKGNPTHTSAAFSLVLNKSIASALVEVYDMSGRRVRVLHSGALGAGSNTLPWDGRHESGARSHTGVYLVRAQLDAFEQVTRVVLLP